MDIFLIVLCVYVGYSTSDLAKRKGQNRTLWSILAIICFFIASILGAFFLVAFFYDGYKQAMVNGRFDVKDLEKFIETPMRVVFMYFSGFGGYLLIKYILERMPDKVVENTELDE